MKKIIIPILLLTFIMLSCKSNYTKIGSKNANYIPYYLKAYEADSLSIIGNYKRSYEILDSLFRKYEPVNMTNVNEYANYIACCVMTHKTKNLDKNIRNSILKYGSFTLNHPNSDTIYERLSKITKVSDEEMAILRGTYRKKFNIELIEKITKMEIEDRSARIPVLDYEKMDVLQKKHEKEIDEIITKYGYPNKKVTGNIYNTDGMPVSFDVVFYHQTAEVKKKYLPMLYEDLLKGKISPNEYGSIVDRIYLEQKVLYYGCFSGLPLINEKKIDSTRRTIGLPSHGYEKWAFNKNFPSLK